MFQYTEDMGLGKYKESPEHRLLKLKLHDKIARLRGRQKQVIKLFLLNKSLDKIAEILNLSKSTVNQYFCRALKQLKNIP